MRTIIILFVLIKSMAFGQSNCPLDNFDITSYQVDSTKKVLYYCDSAKNYIAIYKTNSNRILQFLFDRKFISPTMLTKLTGYIGKQITKVDTINHITLYYSVPQDQYISFPTNCFILKEAKETSRSKNKIFLSIKLESGLFDFNYNLEYDTEYPISEKADTYSIIKDAKLTCVKFTNIDF